MLLIAPPLPLELLELKSTLSTRIVALSLPAKIAEPPLVFSASLIVKSFKTNSVSFTMSKNDFEPPPESTISLCLSSSPQTVNIPSAVSPKSCEISYGLSVSLNWKPLVPFIWFASRNESLSVAETAVRSISCLSSLKATV